MLPQPPFALAATAFRFRALAALAGRLPLGGEREVAMATFVAARLAVAALGAQPLTEDVRKARAAGARQWMGALTLPAGTRSAVIQLAEASANGDREGLAGCVERVTAQAAAVLDVPSRGELRLLAAALRAT